MLLVHINLDRKVVGGSNIWQQTQISVKTTIDNYLCQTLQVLDMNTFIRHSGRQGTNRETDIYNAEK